MILIIRWVTLSSLAQFFWRAVMNSTNFLHVSPSGLLTANQQTVYEVHVQYYRTVRDMVRYCSSELILSLRSSVVPANGEMRVTFRRKKHACDEGMFPRNLGSPPPKHDDHR